MKYRFNDRVIFDSDAGTLGRSDLSEEPVLISNPAKRLLLLLIDYYGKPVSRDLIFKKVWDDYGMISSNNNLNQCVSKLRRIIKVMGIDDEVVATVPKLGFMLRKEIQVEFMKEGEAVFTPLSRSPVLAEPSNAIMDNELDFEESADLDDEVELESDVEEMTSASSHTDAPVSTDKKRWGWGIITALVGLVFVLGIGTTMYTTHSFARQEVFLGKAGSCKVFMSTSTSSGVPGATLNQDMLSYVEQRKAECRPDEYLLVVRSNQVRSLISGVNRLFFVRCTILREHRIEFCSGMESDDSPLVL
ncbi:transcriptional regulator [Serratia fonticola]|uniref:Transcriptional regulator n=1 Tax=Serratia fonticola TaxID=47917 RepID=A0A542BSL2_SERFO|nr:winged helix-turn-helix domain-containing protein [Serratia fonticola]TQI81519.1 transcriptional regulator [Serratia fonticola]TQI96457.1 transcriptional regulator [Serratia fonticola]TVZ70954.1 transcriptional regulator [Serratia fonticola]